jgi:hypothetical protein
MMMVTADDQVKAYIKKIMSQLKEWMYGSKISKLVVVITSKETGEHVERWQFDVRVATPQSTRLLNVLPRFNCLANLQSQSRPRSQQTRKTLHPSTWRGVASPPQDSTYCLC